MKKRECLFAFLLFVLILNFALISSLTEDEENIKVDSAYNCLINKINNLDCSRLSVSEAIFSLLAVNKCSNKILGSSNNNLTCWPSPNCNLKTTSQAVLALSTQGYTTEIDKAEKWLISQNSTPTNLVWYLEIDSNEATTCSVKYGSGVYSFNIDANKKIDKNAGSCLTRAQNNNWFEINKNCIKNEFQISCNKNFISALLFKKQTSNTIHVMQNTNSASAGGTTIEKISALCFSKGNTCDYEGSLWASIVLNKKGYDVSKFMPYLISEEEENEQFFPESFLYVLTGSIDYKNTILQKQIMNKYWLVATDKYYDSALALYPFQLENFDEKTSTKEWLLTEVQQTDGCWNNGNIVDNAFILHSIWPRPFANGTNGTGPNNVSNFTNNGDYDCVENDFFCMSSANCAPGKITYDYDCPGIQICCKEQTIQNCSELNGIICNPNQYCGNDGDEFHTDDLETGEICCVDGACKAISEKNALNECEDNSGVCGEVCESKYIETSLYRCPVDGDKCCMIKSSVPPTTSKKGKWWIWVLLILIILILIGIGLREKLKMLLIKMKSGKKKGGLQQSSFGPKPSESPGYFRPMPGPRRIIPSQPQRMPLRRPAQQKSSRELDDVLKKLKDMSK